MSDLSLVEDNFFTTASETFIDNLSASISAGASTVPVNSAVEYATGDCVVLTVEPGTSNEATFIGKKDTGNQFIECIWVEGNTAVGHSAGAEIIDYDSATHHSAQSKGILKFANQDGSLKTQPIRDALGLGSESVNGWEVLPYTLQVASGYNQGNHAYEVTVANNDLTDEQSVGMKLRLARSVAAPTQCLDLESGSTQYASRASGSVTGTISTVTDDVTTEAWIKPESYSGQSWIVSKRNASVAGFGMNIESDGRITLVGIAASVYEGGTTFQAVPLSKWTHVAMTLDLSGNAYTGYFNGVSVGVGLTAGSGSISAFANAGNLEIGALAGAQTFDGKISDVRVWNAVRTQLQIRDNMNQQLTGSETNLIGYWKLDGNLNDSTSSANNLTGSGGAVATNVDNPMTSTIYALIASISYSAPNTTMVLVTGSNGPIPNGTLASPYYSTAAEPYGFPKDREKWCVEALMRTSITQTPPVTNTWYNLGSMRLLIPIGSWLVQNKGGLYSDRAAAGPIGASTSLSTSASSESNRDFSLNGYQGQDTGFTLPYEIHGSVENSVATTYYKVSRTTQTSPANIQDTGGDAGSIIRAYPNFL